MKSSRSVTGVWRLAILAVVLALGLSAQVALADGTVTVTKAIQGGLTTVDAGVEFTYLINYAYASTTEDGANVTLEDVLDPDLSQDRHPGHYRNHGPHRQHGLRSRRPAR